MKTKKLLALVISAFLVCTCLFASCSDRQKLYSGALESEENRGLFASSPMACFHNGLLFFYPEQRQSSETGGSRVMMVVDIETGDAFPVCGKPDCLHSGEDCNAVLEGNSFTRRFCLCGDRIFWIRRCTVSADGAEGHFLYSSKLDGSDHKQEAVLNHDLEMSLGTGLMCVYNGKLFRFSSSLEVKDGVPVGVTMLYVQEIAAHSQPQVLLELSQPSTVMLKISDGILYAAAFDQTALDLKLYALNTASEELSTLFSGKPPDTALDMFVSKNGDIVFGFSNTVFSYSLTSKSFSEIRSGEYLATDDVLFEMLPGNEFRCIDWNGKLISEGEMIAEGFTLQRFIKRYIGFYDSKLYFCCNDMSSLNDWYILRCDPYNGSFEVLCCGTGNAIN